MCVQRSLSALILALPRQVFKPLNLDAAGKPPNGGSLHPLLKVRAQPLSSVDGGVAFCSRWLELALSAALDCPDMLGGPF